MVPLSFGGAIWLAVPNDGRVRTGVAAFLGALKRPGRWWSVYGRVGASRVLVVLVQFERLRAGLRRGIGTSFTGSGLRL